MTRSQAATRPLPLTSLVTDQVLYRSGRRAGNVGDLLDTGLTGLTLRLAKWGADLKVPEVVVMLDAYATAAVGLPLDGASVAGDADHPAVAELRSAGWKVAALRDWMILYSADRPTVHVGILPWINRGRCPILATDHASTVAAFDLWARIMGTAYHGTPGVAGVSAVREHATAGSRGKAHSPTWQPKQTGPEEAYEQDYFKPGGGRPAFRLAPPKDHTLLHGYDANHMYLGAYAQTPLCPWALKATGELEWSADLAGWWLIEPEPWTDERLPDPLGYPKAGDNGPQWAADTGRTVRWVTAPTMKLLNELREEGTHGGYRVLDSYTGPAKRVLRPVGERLQALWKSEDTQLSVEAVDLPAREAVQAAEKLCYRETVGMLNSPNSRVRRPDWHYAVIAQARANLWRRVRKIGEESGRYPAMIEVDCLYYSTEESDPIAAAPAGLPIGTGLGQFKHHKTLRLQ